MMSTRTSWPRIQLSPGAPVVARGVVAAMVSQWGFSSLSTPREIGPAYGYCFSRTVIVGMCATYKHMAAGAHLPVDQGHPRSGRKRSREGDPNSIWLVRGWDLPNILPLDLNLVLNSQFSTEFSTYFIIYQYIEKLRHNSQLHTTRLNNDNAFFYSEIDSYLILDP
jgi:hypothetical protein